MAEPHELSFYAARLLGDARSFRESLLHPMLVWEAAPGINDTPLLVATRPGDAARMPTTARPLCFVVKKTARNSFATDVTVGRTTNNDVQILDTSVSRFHAYLSHREDWVVVDCASSGGTWVGGKRLKANTATKIVDRTRIKFGGVELTFMEPDSFVEHLRTLAR